MRHVRILFSLFLTLAALGGAVAAAHAAQEAAQTSIVVHVNLCVAAGCTELPEAIDGAPGVEVTLASVDDGTVIGACVTGEGDPDRCTIPVDEVPASVEVTVNPATIPAGYGLEPNPSVYQLAVETPDVRILLYPDDGQLAPPPLPPSQGNPPVVEATQPPVETPPQEADAAPPFPVPLALELPASIYAGTCEALESASAAEPLTALSVVEGAPLGSASALQAATGYTALGISQQDILAGPHAVAVMDEGQQQVIACGDIGGVPDASGAVAFGLAPVNESGAAGVAYLAPAADGGIALSVFLVPEGLLPAATPAQ
jgi:hypothetical protein